MRLYAIRLIITLALAFAWRLAGAAHCRPISLFKERFLNEYLLADLVIDLSGDSLSDFGSHSVPNLLGLLIAIVLNRPFILYSQSIGPFSRLSLPVVRFCLNRAQAITVRERTTYDYLIDTGINPGIIHEFGDCAFAMTPAARERASAILEEEGIPHEFHDGFIGISVSSLMFDLSEMGAANHASCRSDADSYTGLISRVIGELTDRGERVLLVPHVIAPAPWLRDDRSVGREIMSSLDRNDDKIWALEGDYLPEEIKAVISKSKIFIGSRMHACIAALSTGVPTIALGWSHKYDGIMSRLGVREYSFHLEKCSESHILDKITEMIDRHEELSQALLEMASTERKSALDGAEPVQRNLRKPCK